MAAYVVMIRNTTTDVSGLQQYAALSRGAPLSKLEIVASSKTSKFQSLEGPIPEAIVIMRFPTMSDALEWYRSDAYQRALPHRLASGEFTSVVIDGKQ